ncbi:MAG: glycosyl hydrolase 108 family protein [Syntrophorhabdales bacterium]|jgi:lysozyme family protein
MKTSFSEAIEFTFRAEGFYSDNARDPGGETILGISSHYWPREYAIIKDMVPGDATAYATEFYHRHFWDDLDCDNLTHPLDVVVFDSAVNPGPSWARHTLHLTQDWKEFLTMREQHYRTAANSKFLKGLLARCQALKNKYSKEG